MRTIWMRTVLNENQVPCSTRVLKSNKSKQERQNANISVVMISIIQQTERKNKCNKEPGLPQLMSECCSMVHRRTSLITSARRTLTGDCMGRTVQFMDKVPILPGMRSTAIISVESKCSG